MTVKLKVDTVIKLKKVYFSFFHGLNLLETGGEKEIDDYALESGNSDGSCEQSTDSTWCSKVKILSFPWLNSLTPA